MCIIKESHKDVSDTACAFTWYLEFKTKDGGIAFKASAGACWDQLIIWRFSRPGIHTHPLLLARACIRGSITANTLLQQAHAGMRGLLCVLLHAGDTRHALHLRNAALKVKVVVT